MDLFESMLKNDSTTALYKTCEYIKHGNIDKLEDEWIMMTAHIGKFIASGGDTWVHINAELMKLLESDRLNVVNALVMTAKMFLLFQRVSRVYKETPLKQLREEVIDNFPEGGMLSYAGLQKFSKILPGIDDETYPFYSRILAGISHLLADHACDVLRKSLEYLTRKKLKMIMPSVYPAPSVKENKKGDSVWFLWGAILLHYEEEKVATNFKLFTWKYQGTLAQRNARIGLLWGIPYCIHTNVSAIWTKEELKLIERVQGVAKDLWYEVNNTETKEEQNVGIMQSFYPRTSLPFEPLYTSSGIDNTHKETDNKLVKVVKISLKEEFGL